MDTVDFVLTLLAVLFIALIAVSALAARLWYVLCATRTENTRLVAQSRPRSPQSAGYDTGLVEKPIVQVLDAS
jgi:hypothetical protein